MNILKRGVLICVDGKAPEKWSQADESHFRKQLAKYDDVQIVTPQIIDFMFHRIWAKMIARGITELVIAKAEFKESGKLELIGHRCHLPAVGLN